MSKERILETIGQVKDEFIEEAAPKGLIKTEEKTVGITKIYPYLKWGALAACLCLIAGLGMKMNLFSASKEDMAYDAALNMSQTAEMEIATEETKADFGAINNKADADYENGSYSYATGADNWNVGQDSATTESITASDKGFPDWGLTLSVKDVTSSGLTLIVLQSGGNATGELQTGEAYRLITLVDETWKPVEEIPLPEGIDGRGFNSIAYLLPKGETREFDINWEWIFGELPSGTYRFIKEFMNVRESANYDTFEYWVEFEIK